MKGYDVLDAIDGYTEKWIPSIALGPIKKFEKALGLDRSMQKWWEDRLKEMGQDPKTIQKLIEKHRSGYYSKKKKNSEKDKADKEFLKKIANAKTEAEKMKLLKEHFDKQEKKEEKKEDPPAAAAA